ncbi:DNA cytosine methyltransferase (plasmid) [Roseomonas sp. OT10]|uniref:DNA cytosine methyltransferase n=1 Tax=Roseomonas cutis TaxID=2897332 RepID=UPI001E4911C6|nr:DNA cytosine methyltransferase [Roseomonas sp. OT10]UFN51593.1 DNA cytosine methyltransferase [Roseomonas sp. OT10]
MDSRARTIDLFCGAGGLTAGLEKEGLVVAAGVDMDPACRFPYEENNRARFHERDVGDLDGDDLREWWGDAEVRILVGCAPCQPFSRYTQGRSASTDERWRLLEKFAELIEETKPDIVSMENVEALLKHEVHADFVATLRSHGYHIDENVVQCSDYGVPQMRRRLVLLAAQDQEIHLLTPLEFGQTPTTVREEIGDLPRLAAGETDPGDRLHKASALSKLNLRRIRASVPGGTWRDWHANLRAPCHRRAEGQGYGSVYGRMEWDRIAPTMTTQAYAFGSGRFGHPEQDRGLSLREAAILQTFPRKYAFLDDDEPVIMKTIGRLIGNAVPVRLGQVIGRSILRTLDMVPA